MNHHLCLHIVGLYVFFCTSSDTGYLRFTKKKLNLSDCVAVGYVIKISHYQTVELTFDECDINQQGAEAILQHIGDHPILLTLIDKR